MGGSTLQLQAKLMREYYQDFSKYARGKPPVKKIAWVTAFTPVEILEALDIRYVYPESYAAVIAASGKEQQLLEESERTDLCRDCCSYACCIQGSLALETGPRGMPPRPDVLIATNNQCDTLPNWWNILADRYDVPLIVLDYPGETWGRDEARAYVTAQHADLIKQMETLSGNELDMKELDRIIGASRASVAAWEQVRGLLADRVIEPTLLFDGISFLITDRCKPETAALYEAMAEEFSQLPPADQSKHPVYWLGYPLWYHNKRYLAELLQDCRVCGSDYVAWWSLDYAGDTPMEALFSAYNYTFLNLAQSTKDARLGEDIRRSGAVGAVTLHNKSCKCDFVSARNIAIPQAELEIDMIDRTFLDLGRARRQVDVLLENL